jgi:hypothetical protein
MAQHWSAAKSRLAALRHSPVRSKPFLSAMPALYFPLNDSFLSYMFSMSLPWYSPEPHILLFRRPLGTDPQSGRVDPELERAAREEYKHQFGLLRK